jgi:restriction system protein
MTLSMADAAYQLLKEHGKPKHYSQIISEALERRLISTDGLTPGASLISIISRENSRRLERGELPRFDVLGNGDYGLTEWRPIGIERRIQEINHITRGELKKLVSSMDPKAFEELIGQLLIAIGFDEETVEVKGRSGDGGIDVVGVMNIEDVTRIDVAVQVKRVKANIPPEKITALRGSLMPNQRGIFITVSDFSKRAVLEASAAGKSPISLVNGESLLDLLIKHGIGVKSQQHTIYEIDPQYWPEPRSANAPIVSPVNQNVLKQTVVEYPLHIFGRYRQAVVNADLLETGQVIIGNETYNSVSAAGLAVTSWKSCNGWTFWSFINPADNREYSINVLRIKNDSQ